MTFQLFCPFKTSELDITLCCIDFYAGRGACVVYQIQNLSAATLAAGTQNLGNSSPWAFHHCRVSLSTGMMAMDVSAVCFTLSADCSSLCCFLIVITLRIPGKPFDASGLRTLVPFSSHVPLTEDSYPTCSSSCLLFAGIESASSKRFSLSRGSSTQTMFIAENEPSEKLHYYRSSQSIKKSRNKIIKSK